MPPAALPCSLLPATDVGWVRRREAAAACPAACNRCWLAWVRRRGAGRPPSPTTLPCRLPASAIRVSRLRMGVCVVCEQCDYLTGRVEVESGLPIWAGPSDGDTEARTRLDCVAPVEFGCLGVRFDLTKKPNPKPNTELPKTENRHRTKKPTFQLSFGSVRFGSFFWLKCAQGDQTLLPHTRR